MNTFELNTEQMYEIKIHKIIKTLQLLNSHEEDIILSSLYEINAFINKYRQQAMDFLQTQDIINKILGNLEKCGNIRIMTLKIIAKMQCLESTIIILKANFDSFAAILKIFKESNNPIELEHSSSLLSKLCHNNEYVKLISTNPMVDKIFTHILHTSDPEIKLNCLKMIHCTVSSAVTKNYVSENLYFNVSTLNLILQLRFKFLRDVAVDILFHISGCVSKIVQYNLYKENTIMYLVDILCEEKWTSIQRKVLTIIYNCITYSPVQTHFIKTEKFSRMVNLPNYNPNLDPKHALEIISLISKLSEIGQNLQAMIDTKVYETLHEFCKFDCEKIFLEFCDVVTEFGTDYDMIKKLANKNTFREIKKIMQKNFLPWVPYRQAGIKPLHLFLMNNFNLCKYIYKYNIVTLIHDAILNKGDIDSQYYKMTLEIFDRMLHCNPILRYLWNRQIYYQFVQLLDDDDDEVIQMAMHVLESSLKNKYRRHLFLKFDGIEKIAELLLNGNRIHLCQLMNFLKCATRYKDTSLRLVRTGVIQMIMDCGEFCTQLKPNCESIISNINRIDPSIKFYIIGFLNYSDKIRTGFCVSIGYTPHPYLEEVNFSHTVITVNFHGSKESIHPAVKDYISMPFVVLSKSRNDCIMDILTKSYHETNTNQEKESSDVHSSKQIIKEFRIAYRLELPPPPIGYKPMPDYYLKKYLKSARKIMAVCKECTIKEKVQVLAKFVVGILSGHNTEKPLEHQFELYITELKRKLDSNYIPLGYLRLGTMLERALLFKVLADQLQIPCTLQRGVGTTAWNEVCVWSVFEKDCSIVHHKCGKCVVDLMVNVGNLMLKGTKHAECYCSQNKFEIINDYPGETLSVFHDIALISKYFEDIDLMSFD